VNAGAPKTACDPRHRVRPATVHLGDPSSIDPEAQFQQLGRLDQHPVAIIAFVARLRIGDDRLKAPTMSRLALHGGNFRQLVSARWTMGRVAP
jgi:hypothetical protein